MGGNHELTTVTVVVEKRGDRFFIFDGSRFSASFDASAVSVDVNAAFVAAKKAQGESAWRLALAQCAGRLCQKRQVATANAENPWRRKCQTWIASLRHRRNRIRITRKPPRSYTNEVRPDWAAWAAVSEKRLYSIDVELKRRSQNPWRVWAQTVSANHRQRERMLNDYRIEKEIRKKARQVLFWGQPGFADGDS
jgi:hypothetical protein